MVWVKLITTGIAPISAQKIAIPTYPNPTNGIITIPIVKELDGTSFSIVDQFGKIVHQGKFKTQQQTLNLAHLRQGVYYLKASDVLNSTQRIIKL
ncbi:MAG: T9SS type A sorting domain-containing protein [Flavobacteriales bacterium]|nr:T9SS type A sorting domain-containing protein [Flavobacteriales bacterium]